MANRRVTKDVSDNVIAAAVLAGFPLNKLDRIVEFASITTVTVKGSNLIPMRIGDNWFLIDTDTTVTMPGDLDVQQANLVVDNCDVVWVAKANVTATADTTDKEEGTASAKLEIADAFTTGLVATHDFTAVNMSGYNTIVAKVKCDTNLGEGVLNLVYDETAACATPSETFKIPALKAGVWTKVVFHLSATAANRDAVISVGINAASDPGILTVRIDDIHCEMQKNGADYNVYACDDTGSLVFKISEASTYPTGFTAATSRKIGGFHTLCTSVGAIVGHTLTGYVANDILPQSVWDLKHRTQNGVNVGMVYDSATNKWVDIYLASGTGAATTSVNGGTISDNRNWMDFVDDGHAVKKRLLTDTEFQSAAAGSNEETNISGSADPGTTGGHSDTASRRMIGNIGTEDICGVMYQWLNEQSMRIEGSHTHNQTITHKASATGSAIYKDQAETTPNAVLGSAADEDITSDATEIAAWGWYNLPGAKGSLYRQGTYGDVKLRAGGSWANGTACGSRCRSADDYRWYTYTFVGCRFLAEPL